MTTNNREANSQTNKEVNNGQKSVIITCHFTKMPKKIVRGVMHTSEQDMEE